MHANAARKACSFSWEMGNGKDCGSFVASIEELFDQAVQQAQRY